jgi:hypothetical protein
MNRFACARTAGLLCAFSLFTAAAAAQAPASPAGTQRVVALPTLGTPSEDRVRLGQLMGDSVPDDFLIRSPSVLLAEAASGAETPRWWMVTPELLVDWNSRIPYSQNDGALWAGRGTSARVMVGAGARLGQATLVLAPQFAYAQNQEFPLLPEPQTRHSPAHSNFLPPWYTVGATADLPVRFGDRPYVLVDPGESSLTLKLGSAALGGSTESQWWGPGVRNALVLSNNAAGIPHLFLRTSRPLRTRVGRFEAKWIVGGLTESIFFDTISTNSLRSLSALSVTYQPPALENLTFGAARAVYRGAATRGAILANAADVFTSWEHRPTETDTTWAPEAEQIVSLFGRWVFPESGFETYVEWARHELPVSLRDLFIDPNHTQGYTLGFAWAHPDRFGTLRVSGESTFLEYSPTFRHRPADPYYTSRKVPQGYTQRGQAIGAAIGPGSSSLWLAIDHFGRRFQGGLFLSRIRWQAGELQQSISSNVFRTFRSFHSWDASLIGGARAGVLVAGMHVQAEAGLEQRYNFLFQNPDLGYGPSGAVDVRNVQLRLSVTPDWQLHR